ncbi:MAG: hypothetical protein R6X25_00585 [Candidatus Krumholzibacteriia bacterium]
MEHHKPALSRTRSRKSKAPPGLRDLLDTLLSHTSSEETWTSILRRICSSFLRFSGADALTIRIEEGGKTTRCHASLAEDTPQRVVVSIRSNQPSAGDADESPADDLIPEPIIRAIAERSVMATTDSCTRAGSFWIGDTARPIRIREPATEAAVKTVVIGGEFESLALVHIPIGQRGYGVLLLASHRRDFFSFDDIQVYEMVAQMLGMALAHHGAQWALRERIKELTCLYDIATLAQRPGLSLEELLGKIVAILPPGWQYPDITCARILLDGRTFATGTFSEGPQRQSASIIVGDSTRGRVEVFYTEEAPALDEGPFLREERNLINAVAETIGRLVAHRETEGALRERIKELTCLYGIAKVARRPGIGLDEFLANVVGLLPPGWQHPNIAQARIVLDGRQFTTSGFQDGVHDQRADIWVAGVARGFVEVVYTAPAPEMEEGPFLKEERSLIDEVARQVGLSVEHWEADE